MKSSLCFALLFSLMFLEARPVPECGFSFLLKKGSGGKQSSVMEMYVRTLAGAKTNFNILDSVELREIGVKMELRMKPAAKDRASVGLQSFVCIPEEGAFLTPGQADGHNGLSLAQNMELFCGKYSISSVIAVSGKIFYYPFFRPEILERKESFRKVTGNCEIRVLRIRKDILKKLCPAFSFASADQKTLDILVRDPACRKFTLLNFQEKSELHRETFYQGKEDIPSRRIGVRAFAGIVQPGIMQLDFSGIRQAGERLSGSSERPGAFVRYPVFETIELRTFLRVPENKKWVLLAGFSSASSGEKIFFGEKKKSVPEVLLIFFRSVY